MKSTANTTLADRLERLRSDLASQAAKTRRGNVLTLLVGLIAMGAMGGYFYWGYSQFSEVLQTDRVADSVATLVDDNIPGVRKSLEEEARKSAPVWAEGLSKQLRDSLPLGRKKLEDYVVERTKDTLAQGTVLTQEQFTKFAQDNKAALKMDIAALAKSPELADSAISELEKSLTAQLDSNLKTNANELVYILVAFNEKLGKLSKNQKLDQTESIERRMAMLARRVQSEKVSTAGPPANTSGPAGPGSKQSGVVQTVADEKIKVHAPKAEAPKADAPKEQPK